MDRGFEGGPIFAAAEDRRFLLDRAELVFRESGTRCFGFAVLPNHVRFFVQPTREPLGVAFHRLKTAVAQRYRRLRGERGPVFQGRFRTNVLADRDEGAFRAVPAYVLLHPVRAGNVPDARLNVFLRDGRPAAGASVEIVTPPRMTGPPPRLVRVEERCLELDEQGAAQTGFDRGERVIVELEGEDDSAVVLPLTARIDGPGPWTLHWPKSEVTVRATDERGAPLSDFEVRLEGWSSLEPKDGAVRILGARSGPLRFWVDAPGRRMRDLRLVLAADEKCEVVVRLNPVR